MSDEHGDIPWGYVVIYEYGDDYLDYAPNWKGKLRERYDLVVGRLYWKWRRLRHKHWKFWIEDSDEIPF